MLNKNIFTNKLGLVRSILALSLLLTLCLNSTETLFPKEYLNYIYGNTFWDKINFFLIFEDIWIARLISIIILTIVIFGFYPKITGVFHWWISFSFFNSCLIVEGGDQILSILTFLLIPITVLDNRKNHWQKSIKQSTLSLNIGNSILFIIKIQASVIYLQASLDKLYKVQEWRNGTAVYYWFNDSVFGAPDYVIGTLNYFLSFPLFITTISWGVVILELLLSFAIFMKSYYKKIFFKLAFLFHLVIAYMHGLPTFFLAMLGLLILYLLPINGDFEKNKSIHI